MPEAYAISVEHIVKKYGDFTAVDDVSFNVNDGEIFGLLGPNGAGKSTLIRMMTTLIPITSGIARIAGHNETSIGLHRSAGFELVGVEREVGRKHRQWLDVVELQRLL